MQQLSALHYLSEHPCLTKFEHRLIQNVDLLTVNSDFRDRGCARSRFRVNSEPLSAVSAFKVRKRCISSCAPRIATYSEDVNAAFKVLWLEAECAGTTAAASMPKTSAARDIWPAILFSDGVRATRSIKRARNGGKLYVYVCSADHMDDSPSRISHNTAWSHVGGLSPPRLMSIGARINPWT